VHQPLNGNAAIVARVVTLQNTNAAAKAGIMIRSGLEADAAHVLLSVRPGGTVELIGRSAQGAATTTSATAVQSPPSWLKLVRSGSFVTGFVSPNGTAWTQVGSAAATLGAAPYVGLAVTSHDTGTTNTAVFDSVSLAAGSPIPGPNSNGDVVIYASDVTAAGLHGSWQFIPDSLSPNGVKLSTPNGGQLYDPPLPSPMHYVDISFNAYAGTPYKIWLRMRARQNRKGDDSLWVQASDGLSLGSPIYRINTTSGLAVNLANSNSENGYNWGWQNTAYWLTQPTVLTFASTGLHTIRIQVREDGVEFDQVVLSPSTYMNAAPGASGNDTTIVPK